METTDASAAVAGSALESNHPPAASLDLVPPPVEATPFPEYSWTPVEVRANAGWSLLTALSLVAVFALLRLLPSVGWPLVLAAIFSYLFDPLISAIARRGYSRTAATAGLLGTGVLVGVIALVTLVPLAIEQAVKLPAYLNSTLASVIPQIEKLLGKALPANFRDLAAFAQEHLEEIVTRVLPNAGSVVGIIASGSMSVLSFVLSALIIPVVGFYLLRGWPNVKAGALVLVPEKQRPTVVARMTDVDTMLGGFIRGQLTMAALLSVLYSGALSLIGLKLAIVVGLLTGIGNLVPYVGIGTGFALAAGFCFVDFGLDYHLILVFVTYASLLAADGVFITPRVVGDKVGLSPAAVIVAVLACGSMFGFAGVLLAVPVAAILKLVARIMVNVYRHTRFYRES